MQKILPWPPRPPNPPEEMTLPPIPPNPPKLKQSINYDHLNELIDFKIISQQFSQFNHIIESKSRFINHLLNDRYCSKSLPDSWSGIADGDGNSQNKDSYKALHVDWGLFRDTWTSLNELKKWTDNEAVKDARLYTIWRIGI